MTERRKAVASGSGFLPNTSRAYLQKAHKKETDPRRRDRLLAYMQRKDGMRIKDIAGNLNRSIAAISSWLVRAQEEGTIRARYERPGRGRHYLLDRPGRAQLAKDLDAGPEACGFVSGVWDSDLVRRHISGKFGVKYSKDGVLRLVREMGFSWKKPRPRNPKSASKREQDEFKEGAHNIA